MSEDTNEKKVVPWFPWTWAPPAVICGKVMDKLGVPNSADGEPTLPVPVRLAMIFKKKQ